MSELVKNAIKAAVEVERARIAAILYKLCCPPCEMCWDSDNERGSDICYKHWLKYLEPKE